MLQLRHYKEKEAEYAISLRAESLKKGWDLFPEELAWYIYDFFTFALSPYEKLIFYGHYIVGFNLRELSERLHCSLQNTSYMVEKINRRLKKTWETRDTWKVEDEYHKRNKRYSTENKRRSK